MFGALGKFQQREVKLIHELGELTRKVATKQSQLEQLRAELQAAQTQLVAVVHASSQLWFTRLSSAD